MKSPSVATGLQDAETGSSVGTHLSTVGPLSCLVHLRILPKISPVTINLKSLRDLNNEEINKRD